MSGIGHLAVGLAAKPAAPQVPLWALLAVSEINEIMYFVFTAAGIEQKAEYTMSFRQGLRYLTPVSNPWSHGLFMSLVYAAIAAGLTYLVYRQCRPAGVMGLAALSHWGLDFLMHANLPLFLAGSPQVGLGLENSGPGFIFVTLLDLVLVAIGITIYLAGRKRPAMKAR